MKNFELQDSTFLAPFSLWNTSQKSWLMRCSGQTSLKLVFYENYNCFFIVFGVEFYQAWTVNFGMKWTKLCSTPWTKLCCTPWTMWSTRWFSDDNNVVTALFNHQYCYNLLTRLSKIYNSKQACSINLLSPVQTTIVASSLLNNIVETIMNNIETCFSLTKGLRSKR